MDELKPESEVWHLKWLPPVRKRWVGNCEAVLSLGCLYLIYRMLASNPLTHLSDESQIPWMLYLTLGLGISLSVGGVRFGSLPGYLIGLLTLVIQLLFLALLCLLLVFNPD